MPCRIELSEIELELFIGCEEEERASPQPIRFRLSVRTDEPFLACQTDEVRDTLHVEEMRTVLVESAMGARVKTLERLGQLLEDRFRSRFPIRSLEWELRIDKPRMRWSYVHSWSG